MEKNDGGAAFPQPICDDHGETMTPGMSLRDWFAGMALQGILSNNNLNCYWKECEKEECAIKNTETAYRLADAMIAERAKK